MSQRCSILGFDLARMRALFGSKDLSVIGHAYCEMVEEEPIPKDPDEALETLGWIGLRVEVCRRAVFQGVPFRGLRDEDSEHADAAEIFAAYGQKPLATPFEGWKVVPTMNPLADYTAQLTEPTRTLAAYLSEGRPIFGKRCIPEDLRYYAYLTREETAALRPAFAGLRDEHAELRDADGLGPFMESLLAAMDLTLRRKLDLWFSA